MATPHKRTKRTAACPQKSSRRYCNGRQDPSERDTLRWFTLRQCARHVLPQLEALPSAAVSPGVRLDYDPALNDTRSQGRKKEGKAATNPLLPLLAIAAAADGGDKPKVVPERATVQLLGSSLQGE